MKRADPCYQELEALQERLSRLSQASLRLNESLDFNTVLQEILDSARSLAGARYGVVTLFDDSGALEDSLSSGLTPEEAEQLWNLPDGMGFFEYLGSIRAPLRVRDLPGHLRSRGLPELRPPVEVGSLVSFLAAPVLHGEERVGGLFLAGKEGAEEFTREDEAILVLCASQAALVISNARRRRDERRARADLEALIDTCPIGVVVFDARTGSLISFNREASRIVDGLRKPDQPPEQLLRSLTFRRGDGREISLEEVPLAAALNTGETVRAEQIVMQVPDGRSVTTLINATPIPAKEGGVESYVVTLQDLTPLKDLERLQAEFLSMVSHDLRVPLTSIRGSATALLDAPGDLEPAVMEQFHRIIVEQSDRMLELIGALLDVTRIRAGTLPIVPEPVEIAGLVDQARNTFLGGGGRETLDLDLEPDLPLVMADRRRIVQVIGNLLSNAARHSPESSAIRVTAAREDVHVAVAVADEGRGIEAERLPNLFGKFALTEGGEGAREIGGSGLGLAICQGIVEAHGGRIRAESGGPGLGARFTFTIPVVEAAGRDAGPPSTTPSRQEERGEDRILVVDDDPQALTYVRQVLSEAGFKPIVTADPSQAMVLTKESRPHLVLLDLVWPDTDGIELMTDLLGVADVPVIFLSGYGRDQVIARAFEKGAADYVAKPFSSTELVARVRSALRRSRTGTWAEPGEPYVLGELTVDYGERRVTLAERTLELTPAEYGLLRELSVHAGRTVTYDRLLRRLGGGSNPSGDLRRIRTVAKRLRRKLNDAADNPTYLFTQRGVGYRLPKGQQPEEAV